jgi:hypothetical protein
MEIFRQTLILFLTFTAIALLAACGLVLFDGLSGTMAGS